MTEGDSIEQKSEASTIEVTQENGQRNENKNLQNQKHNKPRKSFLGKLATCKVILLDGTEFEHQVDVSYSLN